MAQKYGKVIVFALLLTVGGAMLTYGILGHTTSVAAMDANDPNLIAKSEPALIKDVSVEGVKRDADGKLAQTYDSATGPPKACPT